jgi:hypothetical protein
MDRAAILAVTALALIVGGACSGDDEPAAVSTTTATAVSTTTETTTFVSVADCVSTGDPTVAVPVVTGKRLPDAIRIVEESGLTVIDDEGVPEGDPVGATAVVQAQATRWRTCTTRSVCRISDEGPLRVRAEGLTARSRAKRDCSLHVPVSGDLASVVLD